MNASTHIIHVKNFLHGEVRIDAQLRKKYVNLEPRYESIHFHGTREELNEVLTELMKDEKYYKVIGVK